MFARLKRFVSDTWKHSTDEGELGGKGGAETQLAEVHRIQGTYKGQFCATEQAQFRQIHRTDGFLSLWDHRHH